MLALLRCKLRTPPPGVDQTGNSLHKSLNGVRPGRHRVPIERALDLAGGIDYQIRIVRCQELQHFLVHRSQRLPPNHRGKMIWDTSVTGLHRWETRKLPWTNVQRVYPRALGLCDSARDRVVCWELHSIAASGDCRLPPVARSARRGDAALCVPMSEAPELILYRLPPTWGLPSLSPACIQVEVSASLGMLRFSISGASGNVARSNKYIIA